MIRPVLLIAPVMFAGCSAPTPAPQPTPTPSATASVAASAPIADIIPEPLRGLWTADAAGRCTLGTELRIAIEPKRIRFHESDARVTHVTQVGPYSWGIDADVTGEGETRRVSFDLNLGGDGTLTRVEAPIPDITYTRCKAAR
ncbi:hypothetical protein ACFSC3_02160 [Sphingomonas floccifaciens]|uniref:Lipoprotein n=1 Tax=Sphingomonas floccifaciens TaxID=1844115 RepID=A0ABW4N8U7_9SPHN